MATAPGVNCAKQQDACGAVDLRHKSIQKVALRRHGVNCATSALWHSCKPVRPENVRKQQSWVMARKLLFQRSLAANLRLALTWRQLGILASRRLAAKRKGLSRT